jgi:hypothetical protein
LLLHRRIGRGRLHATELERRTSVLVEIGQDLRGLDGLRRKLQRRAAAHRAARFGNRCAIFRDQQIGCAVKGVRARKVMPYDIDAGRLARLNRSMQLVDRRLFKNEGLFRRTNRLVHGGAS